MLTRELPTDLHLPAGMGDTALCELCMCLGPLLRFCLSCWPASLCAHPAAALLPRCCCLAASLPAPWQVIEAALANAGMEKQEIDWLVMHQANMRIMSAAADRLGVPTGALR